jgi:hypothetical protein
MDAAEYASWDMVNKKKMFGFENMRKSSKIINDLPTVLLFYLLYV